MMLRKFIFASKILVRMSVN